MLLVVLGKGICRLQIILSCFRKMLSGFICAFRGLKTILHMIVTKCAGLASDREAVSNIFMLYVRMSVGFGIRPERQQSSRVQRYRICGWRINCHVGYDIMGKLCCIFEFELRIGLPMTCVSLAVMLVVKNYAPTIGEYGVPLRVHSYKIV
jgi:hypothetical protein